MVQSKILRVFHCFQAISFGLAPDAFSRPHVSDLRAAAYEFIGTLAFLFMGYWGCQTASDMRAHEIAALFPNARDPGPSNEQFLYCSTSFAGSLLVMVSTFARITGGVFNPVISLALFAAGGIRFARFCFYCIAQLIGAIVAAALIRGLYPGTMSVNIGLAPGVSLARGVFLEAFTTAILVLTVLCLAVDKRALVHKTMAPIGIATALLIGHLVALNFTGAGLNPARAFGPAVIHGFQSDHWIYWVGPFVGSFVAIVFYKYLQLSQYWLLGNCDEHTPESPDKERALAMSNNQGSSGTLVDDEESCLRRREVESPVTPLEIIEADEIPNGSVRIE